MYIYVYIFMHTCVCVYICVCVCVCACVLNTFSLVIKIYFSDLVWEPSINWIFVSFLKSEAKYYIIWTWKNKIKSIYIKTKDLLKHLIHIYIYIYICLLVKCVKCLPMVRETGFQSPVKSLLILIIIVDGFPCSILSIIKYISRVKMSNPGKNVPRCDSYWK